ncbi:hypothetical protein KO465_01645 [Candidatus Micrarchaeota archaeon]|nr:hypothetical protein [Candidatus Micrarchaeota archaeon]
MRKGQAAMEYIMSYGWALLVVLAVIGIIIASGVWRRPVQNECFVHPDLPCEVAAFGILGSDTELRFVFRNNQGGEITNVQIISNEITEGLGMGASAGHGFPIVCDPTSIPQGQTSHCRLIYNNLLGKTGQTMRGRYTIQFDDEMGITHNTSGYVRGTVEQFN